MHNIAFLYSKRSWYGKKRSVLLERNLPADWSEVDASFFSLFAANFFGNANPSEFVTKWANLPKQVGKLLRNYMVNEITALLKNLFDRPVGNSVYIKQIVVTNEKKESLVLHSPLGCMSDMCFAQFVDAENFIRAYAETKDEKHLRGLCAVLYSKNPSDKYDNRLVEKRSELLRFANADVIKAVHLNFICFLNWLVDTYPALYSKNPDVNGNEITYSTQTTPPDYTDLVYKLANPKLGTVEQIEQMPAGYVFWLLSRRD